MSTIRIGKALVKRIGYGAMNLTWKPVETPDEQAFATLKAAIDGCAKDGDGALAFINAGHFYSNKLSEDPTNLKLLSRFFEANPGYADKVFLSVKGGLRPSFSIDCSDEFLASSVKEINEVLKYKKMDLFEPARVDKSRSIEEVMATLQKLSKEGHFEYIGLSEISVNTLRKAVSVAPVSAVEMEYSPWALDIEKDGLLDACKELNIPIIAYSPLGRGFLTGTLRSRADIPEGDIRLHFDRFSEENFPKNLKLVDQLIALAKKKGVTSAQLCIAWILSQWDGFLPIPGSTRAEGVNESLGALKVQLTSEDLKEIRQVVGNAEVIGGRYNKHAESTLAV